MTWVVTTDFRGMHFVFFCVSFGDGGDGLIQGSKIALH